MEGGARQKGAVCRANGPGDPMRQSHMSSGAPMPSAEALLRRPIWESGLAGASRASVQLRGSCQYEQACARDLGRRHRRGDIGTACAAARPPARGHWRSARGCGLRPGASLPCVGCARRRGCRSTCAGALRRLSATAPMTHARTPLQATAPGRKRKVWGHGMRIRVAPEYRRSKIHGKGPLDAVPNDFTDNGMRQRARSVGPSTSTRCAIAPLRTAERRAVLQPRRLRNTMSVSIARC